MYITTRPGARLFDSFVWPINVSYRSKNDMSGHVKVLACILLLKVMSSLLTRYFNNRAVSKSFYDEQELMKTNIKF